MIKTAVIGASGFIGSHFFQKYRSVFPDCVGTFFRRHGDELIGFDLRNADINQLKLTETNHSAVIISSAVSNVNWCEAHPDESYEINVAGTLSVIRQCAQASLKIIFLSSDYAFNGENKEKYQDTDTPNPMTEYGRQKVLIEKEIPNLTDRYLICRLSKIYGTEWEDNTLMDAAAFSLSKRKVLMVADDQFFSPTHVQDVVSMILYAQEKNINGLIHACHSDAYSRYQIISLLAEKMEVSSSLVERVSLHAIKGMEKRPLNTTLQCSEIFDHQQSSLLSIEDAVQKVAQNWAHLNMVI